MAIQEAPKGTPKTLRSEKAEQKVPTGNALADQ